MHQKVILKLNKMNIKSLILSAAVIALPVMAMAQARPQLQWPEFQFTTVKANPITSVKNQASSGTCWAFSSVSFVESEIIRINNIKDEAKYPDLSEFFVVGHSFVDRADKYVRLDGKLNFSVGSEADDCLDVIRAYGIVPNAEMTGLNYGTPLPKQGELDALLTSYVEVMAKNPNRSLSTAWKRGFTAIVEEYYGKFPTTFTVDGKTYTPESYRDALNFNPDDYVSLTSYTHHPFYTKFAIEVCDNWRWDTAYNVPIDELIQALDAALENGYTACWGADVSETGFTRDGIGVLLDPTKLNAGPQAGSDQAHWVGGPDAPKPQAIQIVEKEATQETRQEGFDNKTITDDHGMHIFGIAKDQNGKKYYMVKNSWGITGKYDGIWYVSEAYVRNQTLDIMIHKSALPKEIAKKLGVK